MDKLASETQMVIDLPPKICRTVLEANKWNKELVLEK